MPEHSTIYRDALAAARDESADALLAFADAWTSVVADKALPECERLMTGERLRAVRDELIRRDQVSRIDARVTSPASMRYEARRELARRLRERADMLHIFDLCNYHFIHRQGAKEAHSACPVCGGTDRLVITAGPPDFCWCRRCHWHGDVISVVMSFKQLTFPDAVAWLAELYGERLAAA